MDEHGSTLDTHVLERAVEHLAERYAGVLSPEVVERVVFESYATLARTARVRTYLAPLAAHFATNRLAALAHARNRSDSTAPQVLFVGEHDTGRAQVAAALLAHHAGDAAVIRSAGVLPSSAVDQTALEILAERGVDVGQVYPKPVTDDVVRAADRVITFGTAESVPVYPEVSYEDWGADERFEESPDRVRAAVDELDQRVRELWEQLRP